MQRTGEEIGRSQPKRGYCTGAAQPTQRQTCGRKEQTDRCHDTGDAASKELDTDRGLLADAQRNLLEAPDSQPIKDHIATLKGQIIDQEGKLQSAKADEPDLLAEQAEEKGEKAHWKEELDFWAQRAKGIREHIKSLGCDDPASAGAVGDS